MVWCVVLCCVEQEMVKLLEEFVNSERQLLIIAEDIKVRRQQQDEACVT